MTDYTQSTGSSGTMMIRDTGSWVEFWLKAGSGTFNHSLPWAYVINGSGSSWQSFDFQSGGSWQKLGSWLITSSQTVTFKLGSTGTSGLAGPTDFSQYIGRSTTPDPPTVSGPYNITSSTCDLSITNNGDGGAPIQDHQIGYGTDPWNVQYLSALSGYGTWISIGGLTPGATYYFWARAWNSNGWSNWGNRVQAVMIRPPDTIAQPLLASVTFSTVDVSFVPGGNGGSTILAYQVGYGVSSSAPTTTVGATSPVTITGLDPATVYYFFVRAQNAAGWSAWSIPNSARTVAGAYIAVPGGGVGSLISGGSPPIAEQWNLAVPYVNVAGTWKLAEPWVRDLGVWKRAI